MNGKTNEQKAREYFASDTAEHEMTIVRDDEVHRHIRFKKPGSSIHFYELITWPGHLTIAGDMGTFVFRRTFDMFEWFASDDWRINPHYWEQKIEAGDRSRRAEVFSPAYYEQYVLARLREWQDELEPDEYTEPEDRVALKRERYLLGGAVVNELLLPRPTCDPEARELLEDFEFRFDARSQTHRFTDVWEDSWNDYSVPFLWILIAIVDGIRQYREHQAAVERELAHAG